VKWNDTGFISAEIEGDAVLFYRKGRRLRRIYSPDRAVL